MQFLEEVMSTIQKDLLYLEAEPIKSSEVRLLHDDEQQARGDLGEVEDFGME